MFVCVLMCEFYIRRSEVYEQIEYAILTRDIYGLCGVTSGEFCTEVCSTYVVG